MIGLSERVYLAGISGLRIKALCPALWAVAALADGDVAAEVGQQAV